MRVETDYNRKLRIKKKQQLDFRRLMRGEATPTGVRNFIGLNWIEIKTVLEARMLPSMTWTNYGTHWVIDHVAPFWIFDTEDEADMKLLWSPENLQPLVWKDNNHKQGDLRLSVLWLSKRVGYSAIVERLIDRLEKEIKTMDKYSNYLA